MTVEIPIVWVFFIVRRMSYELVQRDQCREAEK